MTLRPATFRNALIISSACLAACTTMPAPLNVSDVHDRTLIVDTHIDIPLTYMTEIDPTMITALQVDLPKLTAGKLDSGFWIVYTPQGEMTEAGYAAALEIARTRVLAIEALTTVHSDNFEMALTADDVRRIVDAGKHAVLVGMENAFPLGPDLSTLDHWADHGVRYVGITHFGNNQFGDSSNPHPERDGGEGTWGGLSPLGEELVGRLNDLGIMVDVSHTGKLTMMQAADLSRTPIIASHSGVKAVADTARNLDDEQLRKIRDVNGVAQMVALGAYVKLPTAEQQAARDVLDAEFGGDRNGWDQPTRDAYMKRRAIITGMAPEANVSDFVDHIDHAVQIAGINHVGIASDFDGGGGVDGWQDASETESVTAELMSRGYNEAEIGKIWGGNLLRVMEAVEADAKP